MPASDHDTDGWPSSANLAYVEALYARYLEDPQGVEPAWRDQFERWAVQDVPGRVGRVGPSFAPRSIFDPPARVTGNGRANGHAPAPATDAAAADIPSLQHRLDKLIRNYRVRGHIVARIDPLGSTGEWPEELLPEYYGFTDDDMDRRFFTGSLPGRETRTLREVIDYLQETYCRYIGAQFMHIDNLEVREWLQHRMESTRNTVALSRKEQIRILTRLTDAAIFEEFIQRKFIGAKSFSLEGAESLIPLLDLAFEKAGNQGVREIVIGMAHRGRLNVLANILGKSPQQVFREFEDVDPHLYKSGGDVKYHLGYSGDWRTRSGKDIHLSLCFNPSHLEFVNPVALGRMRAKQDVSEKGTRGDEGIVMLIHGDAAIAGQGVVQETFNLSSLSGYTTGGSLHIVLNNQIGFTTSPGDARSTRYATDVAKMLQIPIFHVNGEAPEAVAAVIGLAMDFRKQFKRDVVIDMYAYRRRGHNEGDEPSYTQPKMYEAIGKRPSIRETYLQHLLQLEGVTPEDAQRIAHRRTELLEKELSAARSDRYVPRPEALKGRWERYRGGLDHEVEDLDTGVGADRLAKLLESQTRLPEHFHLHPKLKKLLKLKRQMARGERPLDWAAAESLAFATLATEGYPVRLSGQDSQRGTFSHRHAVLHDATNDDIYTPLKHLADDQAPVDFINSPLSEVGVLGFEYGYSLDYPEALVMWEAQFGDFVNVAQVIIDQFITSAEDKWKRLSGLVMLLPHGFEGQGPEHSSGRLERFLMQAAEDNIQVINPTTPAQYFHALRRQVVRPYRKPLIVMSPKSLLRHPRCVSTLDDLVAGRFQRVLADERVLEARREGREGEEPAAPSAASRVLLCSGKVYYELAERREKLGREDVDILRLEQYYPFPKRMLTRELARYADDTPVFWVQEEPANMGAWPFLRMRFCHRLLDRLPFDGITRPVSASPATGSKAAHQLEQERILNQAFGVG